MNKIKLCFIDEDESWRYMAQKKLSDTFDVYIVEQDMFPHNVADIWKVIDGSDVDVVIVDYKLNESGVLPYTGDDVVRVIRKHNKHLPVFMITSFEANAIQDCEEVQIIRGKDMLSDVEKLDQLKLLVKTSVERYQNAKHDAETMVLTLSNKINGGAVLSAAEEADKFDAELYLSELDLDSAMRSDLFSPTKTGQLASMLEMTRSLIDQLSK